MMDNFTNTTTQHSVEDSKRILGSFLLVLSLFGLVTYIIFIVLVFTRKRFHQQSFFVIAGWLGIADCICLILMIGYASPCIILQTSLSTSRVIGGILNIGWFSGLPLITLLAGNRYFCICDREKFRKIFTPQNTGYLCLGSWLFGVAYSIPTFFSCCSLKFDSAIMSWSWKAKQDGTHYLDYAELVMVVLTFIIIYVFNACVLRKIHQVGAQMRFSMIREQRRLFYEKKIFSQFLITSSWLLIFDVPFVAIGYMSNVTYKFGIFVTMAYVVNCSINGWVYLFMNKTVQAEIRRSLYKRAPVSPIKSVTSTRISIITWKKHTVEIKSFSKDNYVIRDQNK